MISIGLTLSGGMLKGAYQAGALQCISERIPSQLFHYNSAASIGMVNAFAFFSGQSASLIPLWKEGAERLQKKSPLHFLKQSFWDSILENIPSLSPEGLPNLYVPLLNANTHRIQYINFAKVPPSQFALYLQAGISLPPFHPPVKIQNNYFYDGALLDNIPVFPLEQKPLDYIFCFYFDQADYSFGKPELNQKIIRFNFWDNTIVKASLFATPKEITQMIESGYHQTAYRLDAILKNGLEDKEYIHYIAKQKSIFPSKRYFIGCDRMVNACSRLARKIAERSECDTE